MTSSTIAYTHGVKCSLQELKGPVEGGLELGGGDKCFLGVCIGKEQSLLATKRGNNSIQLQPPTVY